jgi:hypothetical protein
VPRPAGGKACTLAQVDLEVKRGGEWGPGALARSRAKGRGISGMPPSGNLHHSSDLGVKRARRATRSVQNLGTSAKLPGALGNPEWQADLEYVWRMRTHDALQRLHQRARRMRRASKAAARETTPWAGQKAVALSRSSEWAEHRAQAMALPRADVVAACGTRWRSVRCKCGIFELKVGCDQVQLCDVCRKRHWRKWRKRIVRALDSHVRAARSRWHGTQRRGYMPGVYLITLTVPHQSSIAGSRDLLMRGWRSLTKRASAGKWWGAYALTIEVTPGTHGDGHVHAHVAVVSSWVPYKELHEAWESITGAVVLDVSPPRRGSARSQDAAEYLAKYVTKGIDPAVFTGQKAGEMLVAFRGKRKVTTSKEFWRPLRDVDRKCTKCGERSWSCGAPPALRRVAPGAVLRSMAERIGWWVPRGAVQSEMTLVRPDG